MVQLIRVMGKKKKHKPKTTYISESTLNKIFIVILFILPLIYFAPLLSGSKMMYGSDWLLAGYSIRKWVVDCFKQFGRGPMWDPFAFSGLPFGNPYTFYFLSYLILPVHVTWTYIFVFAVIFAGLGIYLYLKELHLSLYSALLGAIAYMGCGSVLSMPNPGHEGKILSTAFFPFILLSLHKGITRCKLIYFLFAGGIGGIAAVNSHFQLIYYAGVFCVFYLIYHLIWQRKENRQSASARSANTLRLLLYSFCGLLLAVGLVAIHYFPIFGTIGWGARGGERGYKFATSWALPPAELLDLLTPHFSGLQNNYWGENYFKLDTQYLGILPMLLALVAITLIRRDKYIRFFVGLCVVTTIFALGGHTPLYHIPYWVLPGLKKFRAPAMIFYLTSFGVATLSAFAVEALQRAKLKPRTLTLLLGGILGIVIIFWLICSIGKDYMLSFLKTHFEPILFSEYGPQLTQQKLQNLEKNYPLFLHGLRVAIVLIVLNSGLILIAGKLHRDRAQALTLLWTFIAIIILIADQWSIEKKFLKVVEHPSKYFAKDEIVSFLESYHTPPKSHIQEYRVFPLYYEHAQDAYLSIYNIQSVGGYVSNPGERYQKFIGAGESVMFIPANLIKYRRMLDVLNAKYIISVWIPEDLSQYPPNIHQAIDNLKLSFQRQWGVSWEEAHENLKLVYRSNRGYGIYKNETAMPRAWIVHDFKVLSRDEVLNELKSTDFNPRMTVLLEESPSIITTASPPSYPDTVNIIEYTPNKIVCEATLASPGFLVFSENWHPEWRVYVDGKRSKLYVANYTLRAVEVDEGKHRIEFVYESMYFKLGAIITLLSLLFLTGSVIVWFKFYKKG